MRLEDGPELLRRDLWDELHVSKRVVVAQVAVEAADVSDELLPLILGQALDTLHSASL